MTREDAVRARLRERGAPRHVVHGGLVGLLASWERTSRESGRGYRLGLDEWRNDVDARQILHEVWPLAQEAEREALLDRLDAADRRFRHACQPLRGCVWGAVAARREGWTPEEHWWYFLGPEKAGPELVAELARLEQAP